jgi:transketolase
MSTPVTKNSNPQLDQLCINTIRTLALDAVQKANSGHPGLPLGAAPMAYVLWTRFLRHNPRIEVGKPRSISAISRPWIDAPLFIAPLDWIRPTDGGTATLSPVRFEDAVTGIRVNAGCRNNYGSIGQGFANGVGMAMGQLTWLQGSTSRTTKS